MDRGGITIELWGGIECTVARVGDRFCDQVRSTGHHDRAGDIERLASLGIRRLRYPVLWERVAPYGLASADWSWTDARLSELRSAGIEPIVTLLHHGSGPADTNLLDPAFPQKFAQFARAVAERYPWLRWFTPVNEPLTTARFSALYGTWYPHLRDDGAFVRALFNEIRGIALAMREIRSVIPQAGLIQTEDLGKTYSTPLLRRQAEFENERRWASLDLLCGKARPDAPFFRWAADRGCALDDVSLARMRCAPDVIGLNYYVTGERFLDHRASRYPGVQTGGNGAIRYVDVEAVRVCDEGLGGLQVLGAECWERYGVPIAVTEAHLGCTEDEQLRWVDERYREAQSLRSSGVDVRAFTVWSLFGAHDWDSLCTQERGSYEPGAFDVRGTEPRATAIAQWMRATAAGIPYAHPALRAPGWWRRPERLLYERVRVSRESLEQNSERSAVALADCS